LTDQENESDFFKERHTRQVIVVTSVFYFIFIIVFKSRVVASLMYHIYSLASKSFSHSFNSGTTPLFYDIYG